MQHRISGPRLGRMLDGWSHGDGTLHERLATSLRQLIQEGSLPQGTIIPSERALSEILGISRTSVSTVYDDLRGDGWLESRHGSHTWVRRAGDAEARGQGEYLHSYLTKPERVIDLTSGALPGLAMVGEAAQRTASDALPSLLHQSGLLPFGTELLRTRVADYYNALGLRTQPEQILITNGSQHALTLLATMFIEPNDSVLLENPTYRGAMDAFGMRQARIIPVRTDAQGIDSDDLLDHIRRDSPRLLYVMPSAQNPTGRTWTDQRRRDVCNLLNSHKLMIIDDGSTSDLLLSGRNPRPLACDISENTVFTISSVTKLFWGGLRVGWIRGPKPVINRLAELRCAQDLSGSIPAQLIVSELLPSSDLARSIRRQQLTKSYEITARLLKNHAPDWKWEDPSGGSALWIDVQADAIALCDQFQRIGVRIHPGTLYSATESFRSFIRLPFTGSPELLREALERISRFRHQNKLSGTRALKKTPPPRETLGPPKCVPIDEGEAFRSPQTEKPAGIGHGSPTRS